MVDKPGKKIQIDAIFQARLSSTRLPRKLLLKLVDRPLLSHVIERIKCAKQVSRIIVATTAKDIDDPICELLDNLSIPYYRGNEDDVLDRFYQASRIYGVNHILRVTPDDPFKDPDIIDRVAQVYINSDGAYDYISNILTPSFPDGLDVEIFSFKALEKAWKEANLPSEREHVTPYLWKNPEIFKVCNIENSQDQSSHRWTIDRKKDFEFAEAVYKRLYKPGKIFLMQDILDLLGNEPELININKDSVKWEGFLKSLDEDQTFLKK